MQIFFPKSQRTLEIIDSVVGLFTEDELKKMEINTFEGKTPFKEQMVLFCGSFRPKYSKKKSLELSREFIFPLKKVILNENDRSIKITLLRELRDRLFKI